MISILYKPLVLAAACVAPAAMSATSADSHPSAGARSVTIDHAFGETTIDVAPQRIVSLDTQWTDVLVAMGVQPVGYLADPMVGGEGRFPWQQDLSPEATALRYTDALPLEQIAALDPDLIVVTFVVTDEQDYEALSAIAPTIPMLGERQVDPWQEQTVGLNTPTPLSIPYSLDLIRPALEALGAQS